MKKPLTEVVKDLSSEDKTAPGIRLACLQAVLHLNHVSEWPPDTKVILATANVLANFVIDGTIPEVVA